MPDVTDRSPCPSSAALADVLRDRLLAALASGAVALGDRLPSVRDVAGRFAVSRRAAAGAYRQLAHDGLLVMSARSGAYVGGPESVDGPSGPTPAAGGWLLELFTHALDRGISAARLPAVLADTLSRHRRRVAVLERADDRRWAICDELRRDFGLDAEPVDVDTLGDRWWERPHDAPAEVRGADLLLSTPFFGARARRLAGLLGKPACITAPCLALYAGVRRSLARGPVHVVRADPRFDDDLATVLSAALSLDAALRPARSGAAREAAAPRASAITYACDEAGCVPRDGVVYVTRLARHRLASRVTAQALLARSEPELRVLSRDAARTLLGFMLGAPR